MKKIARLNLVTVVSRGRHPGQGPRDPAGNPAENLGPGLLLKSGTQIQNLRDLGLKFEKSETRDWDRDVSKNPGPEPELTIFSSGTETRDLDSNLGDCPGD